MLGHWDFFFLRGFDMLEQKHLLSKDPMRFLSLDRYDYLHH